MVDPGSVVVSVSESKSDSESESDPPGVDGNVDSDGTRTSVYSPRFGSTSPEKLARTFAMKTVNSALMSKEEIVEFENEIAILREIDHPNVVQLFECYTHKRKMWLVMEMLGGGDLTSRDLDECRIVDVMEQILSALCYLHKRNICHRDLKLENVMFESLNKDSGVKLIDFGLSEKFTRNVKMHKACGTLYTAAPELLVGSGYTSQSDVWSAGCCAYVMLSAGQVPFLKDHDDLKDQNRLDNLRTAKYKFGGKFKDVSKAGREFISFCLRAHPGSRWTAKEALVYLKDKWVPGAAEKMKELEPAKLEETPPGTRKYARKRMNSVMVKGIRDFAKFGDFKKKILVTMAHTMDKGELGELGEMFISMDTDNEGTISPKEFREALMLQREKGEKGLTDEVISEIFRGLDHDESGQLHYMEFLAAVAESQGLITQERLIETFDRLDSDNSGFITVDNLREILGTDFDDEVVAELVKGADENSDGRIDYEEFCKIVASA